MTASRGIRRAPGEPTIDWLKEQTIAQPCPVPALVGDCWVWQRAKTDDGYGRICIHGRDVGAHRATYEVARGPIPCWLTLDHLCRRRDCINPAHQEPVTQQVNTERGFAPTAVAHRTGICRFGHPLAPVSGKLRCRVCQAAKQRESYERKRQAEGKPVGRPQAPRQRRANDNAQEGGAP